MPSSRSFHYCSVREWLRAPADSYCQRISCKVYMNLSRKPIAHLRGKPMLSPKLSGNASELPVLMAASGFEFCLCWAPIPRLVSCSCSFIFFWHWPKVGLQPLLDFPTQMQERQLCVVGTSWKFKDSVCLPFSSGGGSVANMQGSSASNLKLKTWFPRPLSTKLSESLLAFCSAFSPTLPGPSSFQIVQSWLR